MISTRSLFLTLSLALIAAGASAEANRTLADSIVILERAVNALASPAADYVKILQGVALAWPPQGQRVVEADLAGFLTRVPGARADFKCSADFVRQRARKELLRLKDSLLDADPQPARPQVCYAAPFAIDPARPIGQIEIYGYDFDREPVQVLLMDRDGFQDVTPALITREHYHLTLDLERNGFRFSSGSQRLAVAVGHLIQHEIPVVQADTPLCDSRVEETPAGKTIGYQTPLLDIHRPFSGAGATVFANAALDFESNKVDATVCMTAVDAGNRSGASGCAVESVYSTEPDRVVEGVIGGLEDQITYAPRHDSGNHRKGFSDGPVDHWVFNGFGGQTAGAAEPRVAIKLRATRIISTKAEGCISPITYLEAKRTRVLSEATTRRLDPQLKKIDPALLERRPRFSPS